MKAEDGRTEEWYVSLWQEQEQEQEGSRRGNEMKDSMLYLSFAAIITWCQVLSCGDRPEPSRH